MILTDRQRDNARMYKKKMKRLDETGIVRTATVLNGEYISSKIIFDDTGKIVELFGDAPEAFWSGFSESLAKCDENCILEVNKVSVIVETATDNPRLVILGGGHVAYNLAMIAAKMDFAVTVADDRDEFVTKERYPDAESLISLPYEEVFEHIPDAYNTYYVIVTRGHKYDTVCLRECLKRRPVYIGMIGSKGKVASTMKTLLEEGFDQSELDKVHSPIGLKLGGNLPMEVAVSIAAQLIQIRSAVSRAVIDHEIKNIFLNDKVKPKGVMVTIIEKKGSSPRGIGSKMFVSSDGSVIGSIGGGNIEFEALKFAKTVDRPQIARYDLSNSEGAKLGMACGGHVTVFYEII